VLIKYLHSSCYYSATFAFSSLPTIPFPTSPPPHFAYYFESKVVRGLYSNILVVSTIHPKNVWDVVKSHDDLAVAIQRNTSNIGHKLPNLPKSAD